MQCRHHNFSTVGLDKQDKDILQCDDCHKIVTYQEIEDGWNYTKPKVDYPVEEKIKDKGLGDDDDYDEERDYADRLNDKIDEDRQSMDLEI